MQYKDTLAVEEVKYPESPVVIYVDGVEVNYSVKPIMKSNKTFVPIRETFEAMGATVKWDIRDRAVYATKDDIKIKLVINYYEALINEKRVPVSTPFVYKNKTMIPLRFVGEAFGGEVKYVKDDQSIYISISEKYDDIESSLSFN